MKYKKDFCSHFFNYSKSKVVLKKNIWIYILGNNRILMDWFITQTRTILTLNLSWHHNSKMEQ